MINLVRIILFLLITTFVHAQEEGNDITVEIIGIDNNDGQMRIGLYGSKDNWLKKPLSGMTGKIVDGKCKVLLSNIPDGTYAISVFHDENNDGKLETNFLRIPSEDTGSSNDAPSRFGPPKWEDAKFEVKGGTIKQVITL